MASYDAAFALDHFPAKLHNLPEDFKTVMGQSIANRRLARAWIVLVQRCGGIHHGYFIPRATPDGVGVSFPGLGYDGPADVAVAMFTFPSEEAYRSYREMVATDPESQAMAALVRKTNCFTRYERLFLQPVQCAYEEASSADKSLETRSSGAGRVQP